MEKKTKQLETAAAAPEAPDQIKKREWLAIRKKAGRKIDPESQRAQREQFFREFIKVDRVSFRLAAQRKVS
jgi:hypothetical protein